MMNEHQFDIVKVPAGFFTYNDNYSEENYEYEEGSEEEEDTFLPVFLSAPTTYRVTRGNTARLECRVDRWDCRRSVKMVF